ncbi:small ribosomal subunit protein mS26 [Chironomus tepperi]|uniref:small ribosomal subunit protein mS26 n=1 Tax=Chironomus tepperi TaxID=113505 RepID=UPI00391F53E3
MLRNYQKVYNINQLVINQNLAGLQSVRWRRKPRWLPTAPSKVFRVPERHVLPYEEKIEWQRLNNNYRTQVNSIRRYLINEVEERKKMFELQETPADEEAEFQRCFALNEQWNQEIAKSRILRVEEENEKRREEILLNLERRKQREEIILKQVEEKVKIEKENAETFITRETIDRAIEIALANPIDFNFSIDPNGKRSDVVEEKKE